MSEFKILTGSKELDIAIKLRKCNETIRNLYKADFEKEITQYKHFIKAAMVKHKINNEIESAMKLIEEAKGVGGSDMFTVKILAACVELMEGR